MVITRNYSGPALIAAGVIGMQSIALMISEKVDLFDPKNLTIGAVILVIAMGGHIGYPGGFLPIPLLTNIFPNGWLAIATYPSLLVVVKQ